MADLIDDLFHFKLRAYFQVPVCFCISFINCARIPIPADPAADPTPDRMLRERRHPLPIRCSTVELCRNRYKCVTHHCHIPLRRIYDRYGFAKSYPDASRFVLQSEQDRRRLQRCGDVNEFCPAQHSVERGGCCDRFTAVRYGRQGKWGPAWVDRYSHIELG